MAKQVKAEFPDTRVVSYLKHYLNDQTDVVAEKTASAALATFKTTHNIVKITEWKAANPQLVEQYEALQSAEKTAKGKVVHCGGGTSTLIALLQKRIVSDVLARAVASHSGGANDKLQVSSLFVSSDTSMYPFIAFYRSLTSFRFNREHEEQQEQLAAAARAKKAASVKQLDERYKAEVAKRVAAGDTKEAAESFATELVAALRQQRELDELRATTYQDAIDNGHSIEHANALADFALSEETFKNSVKVQVATFHAQQRTSAGLVADDKGRFTDTKEVTQAVKTFRDGLVKAHDSTPPVETENEDSLQSFTGYIKKIYEEMRSAGLVSSVKFSARFFAALNEVVQESLQRIAVSLRTSMNRNVHGDIEPRTLSLSTVRSYIDLIFIHENVPANVRTEFITQLDTAVAQLQAKKEATRAKADERKSAKDNVVAK